MWPLARAAFMNIMGTTLRCNPPPAKITGGTRQSDEWTAGVTKLIPPGRPDP
jgi:hypothetical protein